MRRSSRASLNLELVPSRLPAAFARHALRWGLLLLLAVFTYVLFPVAGGFDTPVWATGEVASSEVIAPFAFDVRKSPTEIAREASAIEATALPIYDFHRDYVDSSLAAADAWFSAMGSAAGSEAMVEVARQQGLRLTLEEAEYLRGGGRLARFRESLRGLLRRQLGRGVAPAGTLEGESHWDIVVRRGAAEGVARRDTLLTFSRFIESRFTAHPDPTSSVGDVVYVKLITGVARATLVPNAAESARVREELRLSVDPVKDRVRDQERVVDANEVVTADVHERLVALRAEWLRRGGGSGGDLRGTAGQVLTNGMILAVFWLLLMFYRPAIYESLRQMLVLAALFGVVIAGAAVNHRFIAPVPELIPVPFAAMLITVMFRGRVAMVAALVLAVLITSQAVFAEPDALFVAMVGGVSAAVSVRRIRRRTQFLLAAGVVAAAYLLVGITVGLRLDLPLLDIGQVGLRGGLNAVASAALASTVLPVFEVQAGLTTDLTLLELSDPDRPLLRRLATEAPGTYAHSVAVANLCEAACNAVGAHGLLARVGCYYHDIGKVKKPHYFVENQSGGVNPHDKLKPEVSANIVRNHVRDGLALADEHRLPAVVKAFIPEHHGTMEITYFLERARSRADAVDVADDEFRYPGPRPRSVETAVAMLADGVEAAVRVLDDPTPDTVRDAVHHLIQFRIESGQLQEAPLTLAQLARIEEEFVRVTAGVYHNRIDDPPAGGGISADWEATSDT